MNRLDYTDDVSGFIIGEVAFPYEFWIKDEYGNQKIDHNFFSNDDEAIEWFKKKYPDEFKNGVEMRVFDK